jgi:hypothetical protein
MPKIGPEGASGGGQPAVPANAYVREDGVVTAPPAAAGTLLAANNLSDVASATAAQANLGLGSAALLSSSAVAQTANNLSDLASAATARTNLGLGAVATESYISGQYLAVPAQYAPATQVLLNTLSATMASLNAASTTVASGSNGGEISTIASWSAPSSGVLDVASTAGWPSAGTFTVATSTTTATCTYAGTTAASLTGCAYVSGSATGTVATGGAVTLTAAGTGAVAVPAISTGSFTAPPSGSVVVTANFAAYVSSGGVDFSFGLAAHGTLTPMVCENVTFTDSGASTIRMYTVVFLVNNLTGINNLDLMFATASATLTVRALGSTSTTPTGTIGAPVTLTVQAV